VLRTITCCQAHAPDVHAESSRREFTPARRSELGQPGGHLFCVPRRRHPADEVASRRVEQAVPQHQRHRGAALPQAGPVDGGEPGVGLEARDAAGGLSVGGGRFGFDGMRQYHPVGCNQSLPQQAPLSNPPTPHTAPQHKKSKTHHSQPLVGVPDQQPRDEVPRLWRQHGRVGGGGAHDALVDAQLVVAFWWGGRLEGGGRRVGWGVGCGVQVWLWTRGVGCCPPRRVPATHSQPPNRPTNQPNEPASAPAPSPGPANGICPDSRLKISTPSAHQSTASVWPVPSTSSGARYWGGPQSVKVRPSLRLANLGWGGGRGGVWGVRRRFSAREGFFCGTAHHHRTPIPPPLPQYTNFSTPFAPKTKPKAPT
jgi:hypothetical protein